jgi:hypothetical protein
MRGAVNETEYANPRGDIVMLALAYGSHSP